MPAIILAALALLTTTLISGGIFGPTGNSLIPDNQASDYGGVACLDESMIGSTPLLRDIPKPDNTNLPFPNSGLCGGRGGSCSGPASANYMPIAGAENVLTELIWPSAPTTRLMKQKLPAENKYDAIRDLVYRPSCNDWCALGLPYGGTFHCDFIFLYKPAASPMDNPENWQTKDGERYPKDRSIFQVLFREGGTIPDYAGQTGRRAPLRCSRVTPAAQAKTDGLALAKELLAPVFAQEPPGQSGISIGDATYVLADEFGRLLRRDLRPEDQGRQKIEASHPFRNQNYEVYKNLSTKLLPTDEIVYLVAGGKVTEAENSSDSLFPIDYLEFRRLENFRPQGRTLQLGSFKPFFGKGWWKKWVDESKPAIYFYPPQDLTLSVKLQTKGKVVVSEPFYDPKTGWQNVLAHPDGTLTYQAKNYPYLFYEAVLDDVFVASLGTVVPGHNLVTYFEDVLPKMGLNRQETRDFIDYWMRRLSATQPYYFINWLTNDQIEWLEPIQLSIQPDTKIRLRAYFKPLAAPMSVAPQNLPQPSQTRRGFTMVEWGGILDQ